MKFRLGLCCAGKARMLIDGKEAIDLWTSQPEKTADTPMFNSASMERFADVDVVKGQELEIVVFLTNEAVGVTVGAIPSGGVRIGGFEVLDEDAVKLAEEVDYPVVITGLSSDWEYEGSDRTTLGLPGRVDELITKVVAANPNTVSPCTSDHFWTVIAKLTCPDCHHTIRSTNRNALD
jgi:beta-glucosidase